ncbi:MAG: hypothetical protein HZB09_02260 [Candidatus Yonathbacteria bacterium]|nr:hypothetical protein [Candidatus Yonathbacteria bacterium]
MDIQDILWHNAFWISYLSFINSTTEQTGDFSVQIIAQYARKDKVKLYLTPGEGGFNPPLLCALKKSISTHLRINPLSIEGNNGNIIMAYNRPTDKAPDTLVAFGRLFLSQHTHITSCDGCNKKKNSCNMTKICEDAQKLTSDD